MKTGNTISASAPPANQSPHSPSMFERVTLYFSAKSLVIPSGSRGIFALVLYEDRVAGSLTNLGVTEIVRDRTEISWIKNYQVNFSFREIQEFIVRIYSANSNIDPINFHPDAHQLIGGISFRLSNLVTAFNQCLSQPMNDGAGIVEARAEVVSSTRDNFVVTFAAKALKNKEGFFSTSDPFLVLSRLNEDGTWSEVWKGDYINSNLNPAWKPVKLPLATICNGDIHRPLKITIFDYEKSGRHVFMGEVETSIHSMLSLRGGPMNVIEPLEKARKSSYVNSGVLYARNTSIESNASFTDFISCGCEISLLVGIDFTSSNGDPSLPSSLHYMNPTGAPNPYQTTITSVGSILEPYDSDRKYPVYGFGARLREPTGGLTPAQHCFAVYGGGYEVAGLEGILQAYRDALQTVSLSGPTLFAPLIRSASEYMASLSCTQASQKYGILLILTDGMINDMELTKAAIIEASSLPISIIIVGIGEADFSDMHKLDSDDSLLTANGKTASRDIVQFVAMRDFASKNKDALSNHVLEEVPNQFLQYMQKKGIVPNKRAGA